MHTIVTRSPPAEAAPTQDDIRALLAKMGRSYTLRSVLRLLDRLGIARTVQFGYLAILNRDVDPEGEKHYGLLLRTGMSQLEFLQDLASSREFRGEVDYAHHRDDSDLHFLTETHQRILRRPIDPATREDLLSRTTTREEWAAMLSSSSEAQDLQRFREEVRITLRKEERKQWWRALLGRQIIINIMGGSGGGDGRAAPQRPATQNPDAALSAMMNMHNIQQLPAAARAILMQAVFGGAGGNDTATS